MTQHADLPSEQLPTVVRDFLAAHIVRDADTASKVLTEDVVAVDQGETVRGRDQVHAFLRDAGSEFEYTTEQIGARRVDETHFVATVRLEGTFPGGTAELDYRFTLRDDRIAEIVIANHEA
ncbi:nuclear transport factor 2 family protein [Actinoplanes sp. LDG1-06]|uniref:Nuclear transport factor 2 family protein n=1 Tax=Paractinoplanes ovalisporus TaxID=2810368 RepID=A0ABS2A8S0_9ACTN|nr:nuclear transport factor 2 family protein [Actinoplanes ovalisporus]MBM2616213.1 nuclear transport factor 2 family protein [Actinoplanes ovalisporus]